MSDMSLDEALAKLDDSGMFGASADAARALHDADDDELIRLAYAYDDVVDDVDETVGDLASRAMVISILRERGYELKGEPGDVEIYDPDGEYVPFESL